MNRLRTIFIITIVSFSVAIYIGVHIRSSAGRKRARITEARMQYNWYLIELYHSREGSYPSPGKVGTIPHVEVVTGDLRRSLAKNDGWGVAFLYVSAKDGSDYRLISYGGIGVIEDLLPQKSPGCAAVTADYRANVVFGSSGVLVRYDGFAFHHPVGGQRFSEELATDHMKEMEWSLPLGAKPVPIASRP